MAIRCCGSTAGRLGPRGTAESTEHPREAKDPYPFRGRCGALPHGTRQFPAPAGAACHEVLYYHSGAAFLQQRTITTLSGSGGQGAGEMRRANLFPISTCKCDINNNYPGIRRRVEEKKRLDLRFWV